MISLREYILENSSVLNVERAWQARNLAKGKKGKKGKARKRNNSLPSIQNTNPSTKLAKKTDDIDIEGLMNLSGSHAMSATEENDIQTKFNQMELGIARNSVIQEIMNSTKDNELFLVNGELYGIEDVIHFVTDKEGKIQVKLSMQKVMLISMK